MNFRWMLLFLIPSATGYGQTPESGKLTDTALKITLDHSIASLYIPPISYERMSPILFSEIPVSTCLFFVDSTPYRRIDSLKHAVDSLGLLYQIRSAAQSRLHQKALMLEQLRSQKLESALLRYKKLCVTGLVLILALLWMLFRVRRHAMSGKPLVLPHESAHEPTAGIS